MDVHGRLLVIALSLGVQIALTRKIEMPYGDWDYRHGMGVVGLWDPRFVMTASVCFDCSRWRRNTSLIRIVVLDVSSYVSVVCL